MKDELPFVTISIAYHGERLEIPAVLIDTGSATTILATDIVASIQIVPSRQDILKRIRGVGGIELVFRRDLDYLQIGDCLLPDFTVDIGWMDHGFEMNGILGMDVLTRAGAIIDLQQKTISFANPPTSKL
ncbi:MAG: hypothetical protein GY801_48930 [bacterium]|nr:hypothetical protein [bacterium]